MARSARQNFVDLSRNAPEDSIYGGRGKYPQLHLLG